MLHVNMLQGFVSFLSLSLSSFFATSWLLVLVSNLFTTDQVGTVRSLACGLEEPFSFGDLGR